MVRLLLLCLGALVGCSRRAEAVVPDATPAASASVAATAPPPELPRSGAVFSAPIAATRTSGGMLVAGLVASEGVIRVTSLAEQGPAAPGWASVDALRGVAWVADADLELQSAAGGLALVWRGLLAGKAGTTLVVLGPHGEGGGDGIPIGAGWCATDEGVAWLDPRGARPLHLRGRRWADSTAHDLAEVPADRAPALVCGDHQVFLLADGDDDLTVRASSIAGAPGPWTTAIRDKDFGDDDEREHEAFATGDTLGLVRVGDSGTVWLREIEGGHASPWKRMKHALAEEDDLVAVDGDATATVIVSTREGSEPCGGESGALSVRALRVDRATGADELSVLAPADCASTPGPFWVGSSHGTLVAWGERRSQPAPGAAPIEHLAYRAASGASAATSRLDLQADALVDAGCDATGCFVAALLRLPGSDVMQPGPIAGFRYLP
jgi:hypothetical protein